MALLTGLEARRSLDALQKGEEGVHIPDQQRRWEWLHLCELCPEVVKVSSTQARGGLALRN